MGASVLSYYHNYIEMVVKALTLFLAFVAVATFAAGEEDSWAPRMELPSGSEAGYVSSDANMGEENIVTAAHQLRALKTPSVFKLHVDRITKHAELLQSFDTKKAKAYAHAFNNSKNAIRAALRSLNIQLNAGH